MAVRNGTPDDDVMSAAVFGDEDETNTYHGLAGDDQLIGGNLRDFLWGDDGDDTLEGGGGADYLSGDGGVNTLSYAGSDAPVTVNLKRHTVSGGDADGDYIRFIDNVVGSAHNDRLGGDNGDNVLSGGAGNDRISAGLGDDTLYGGDGNDQLLGYIGADTLYGGAGGDKFSYSNKVESTVAAPDTIMDFSRAEGDRIRLTSMSPDGGGGFTWIGTAEFNSQYGGQLRYEVINGDSHVYAEVNGDNIEDFSIILHGITDLSARDFLL